MKPKFTLLILMFCLSIAATAQEFGIKGGLNFSSVKNGGNNATDYSTIVGPMLGVFWIVQGSDNFTFHPEVLFSFKGIRYQSNENGNAISGKDRIGYLEVPLNFGYNISLGSNKLTLCAGPYLGVGVTGAWTSKTHNGSRQETHDGNVVFAFEINEDNYENSVYKRIDLGMNLGMGYRINKLILEATYGMGVIDIVPQVDLPDTTIESPEIFNRCLRLGLSYVIRN